MCVNTKPTNPDNGPTKWEITRLKWRLGGGSERERNARALNQRCPSQLRKSWRRAALTISLRWVVPAFNVT